MSDTMLGDVVMKSDVICIFKELMIRYKSENAINS